MGSVLNNAILAFLESPRRGTLADLRRFLLEPSFRAEFLRTVQDPNVIYYWQKGFPQLTGNKSIGPVLTRLETFLSPKPIRYMVSQSENRLDFGHIMDTGKIFLAKLSQGLLGRENSYLLGTLLVSKFQQLAMSRQAQQIAVRKDFWLNIDEFSPWLRVWVGYDFIYISDVLRPGHQVNSAGLAFGPTPNHTDFWAQGVNFGVGVRF